MGDFETHMGYGVASHIVASVVLIGTAYSSPFPLLAAVVGVIAFPVTIAGAAFPDIDHPSSKPNRMFTHMLARFGVFATAYVYGLYGFLPTYRWMQTAAPTEAALPLTAVFTVLLSLAGGVGARRGFEVVRPHHRGMTHRIPTGGAVSLCIGVVAWGLSAVSGFVAPGVFAVVCAGLFFAGFLSHLACDRVLFDVKTYTQFT